MFFSSSLDLSLFYYRYYVAITLNYVYLNYDLYRLLNIGFYFN